MTRADELSALLERVEKATGPDRELDAAICAHFRLLSPRAERERWAREWSGPVIAKGDRVYLSHSDGRPDGLNCDARPLTASLDAALALVERVLPGWFPEMEKLRGGKWYGCVNRPADHPEPFYEAVAPAPTLALLTAMLKALVAQAASPQSGQAGELDEPILPTPTDRKN